MGANLTKLKIDSNALDKWQLAKSLVLAASAQTAVTAAKLMQCLDDISFAEAFEVFPTGQITAFEVGFLGVASGTHTATAQIYGFEESGWGRHIGQVVGTFGSHASAANAGFHQSAFAHSSVRDAFLKATAYNGCDAYAESSDYPEAIIVPATSETNFPSTFILSLPNNQYSWIGFAFTAFGTATSAGAIFRPLGRKSRYNSPDGL